MVPKLQQPMSITFTDAEAQAVHWFHLDGIDYEDFHVNPECNTSCCEDDSHYLDENNHDFNDSFGWNGNTLTTTDVVGLDILERCKAFLEHSDVFPVAITQSAVQKIDAAIAKSDKTFVS